jgi:hypothetical protein
LKNWLFTISDEKLFEYIDFSSFVHECVVPKVFRICSDFISCESNCGSAPRCKQRGIAFKIIHTSSHSPNNLWPIAKYIFRRIFLLNAISGVSRCSNSRLPCGLLLYHSLNSSNKEKANRCLLYSPNHRSNFPFV